MSIRINGKLIASAGGGGAAGGTNVLVDDLTIEKNSSDIITTIGTKAKSGEIIHDWIGTLAEYNEGVENGTIPDNWVCWVTDDNDISQGPSSGGSNGSGNADIKLAATFNLFDTKIADHILEGKEATGWALQGTYVTKDLYPDFYNKCLEEYENGEAQISTEPWTQPVATGEITAIDGGDMVITSSEGVEESYYPYLAFDGDYSKSSSMWSAYPNTEAWWQIKFPYKIKITGLTFYQKTSGTSHFTKDARFYTSSDMNIPIGDAFVGTGSNFAVTEIQNIPAEGIITDTIYLNITSSHNGGVGMGDLKITAEKVIGEIRNNPNGHRFYPISIKSFIDEIYNQYGIADFYGIDEENERIFLPRNKYFALTGGVMGNGMTLGLTDGTNNFGVGTSALSSAPYLATSTAVYGSTNIGSSIAGSNATGKISGITTDPTKSGIVLEANENKYLYYCVGNTEVTQAITNVTEVTTSENDTIPLFTGMYFDFKPNNVSWLKAGVQQNSAGVYKTCYETLVQIVNGVNNYDLKVINKADMISGVVYDEHWILDQDNMTFRTPLTISNKALSGGVMGNGKGLVLADGTYTNTIAGNNSVIGFSGASEVVDIGAVTGTVNSQQGRIYGLIPDPTKSGIIAEQSTAQLYFKVANAVQNIELLDAGEVLEGLANKLDISHKEEIVSWGMPDYSAGIALSVNVNTVAQVDSIVYAFAEKSGGADAAAQIVIYDESGVEVLRQVNRCVISNSWGRASANALVPKGYSVTIGGANIVSAQLFPLKGAK